MAAIDFYKDTNGIWHVGDYFPKPQDYLIKANAQNIEIFAISNVGFPKGFFSYSELLDSSGNPYNTKAAFLDAAKEFLASSGSAGGSVKRSFSTTITRPGDTNAYTALDVIADVSATQKLFSNVALGTNYGVQIVGVRISSSESNLAGTVFRIHFFKSAPTFIADNAAMNLDNISLANFVGATTVVMGVAPLNKTGKNDYTQIILNPTAKDIYFILETVSGYTPSASATFTVTIDCELSVQ